MTLFRSLTDRTFRLLWSGQTISRIGDFLYEVTLAWWVLEKTGSATTMGLVLIFSFTPMLLFLLIGGVAVDRLPRVRVMLVSDLLRGAIVLLISILAFGQLLEVWHVLIASLLFGLVDAFFQPAYTALVPQIVPSEHLPSANSLTSISVQIGRILGPALGAGVIALVGTAGAFVFNGLSFFVSALCLMPLVGSSAAPVREEGAESSSLLQDAREGIQTVLGSPVLWISIIMFALTNITLVGPYSVAMPFLIKEYRKADVATLGLLYATFPIGYIIGGVWLGRLTKLGRRGLTSYTGLMIAGLMLLVFGTPVPIAVLLVAALINGAALEIGGLIWTNILQEHVPPERLGRVASIDSLGSFALLPIGYALTGWATDQLGPAPVFVIGGGMTAVLALLAMCHPVIRSLD